MLAATCPAILAGLHSGVPYDTGTSLPDLLLGLHTYYIRDIKTEENMHQSVSRKNNGKDHVPYVVTTWHLKSRLVFSNTYCHWPVLVLLLLKKVLKKRSPTH